MGSILDKRLVWITGKGGVGKSTVAAALGMAGARRGKRTIVCEVGAQERLSRLFRRQGVAGDETLLTDELWATSIDPQAALREWLGTQVGGTLARALNSASAFQYFVAAAPGAKELVTVTKVWELGQSSRWKRSARGYDLVVVDAPASGHGVSMLRTPKTFADLARIGPIHKQADLVCVEKRTRVRAQDHRLNPARRAAARRGTPPVPRRAAGSDRDRSATKNERSPGAPRPPRAPDCRLVAP